MAFGSVTLLPGVNVERTPTLLRAGISVSQLIRFKDSLVQKGGGWAKFIQLSVTGIPRDLHAWQDLNNVGHLSIGTTARLDVATSGTFSDISPQTLTSNFAANISTVSGSPLVTIVDPNISGITLFDTVYFSVPVSIGGVVLDGLYAVTQTGGGSSYQITASANATTTATNPTATNGATLAGNNTLHFAATPPWVVVGMSIANLDHPTSITPNTTVTGTSGTTVTMSNNAAAPGVSSGDHINFASIPVFTTTSGSQLVSVNLIGHGLSVGSTISFSIPTVVDGITISGSYIVVSVADANNFSINAVTQSTSTTSVVMNNGNAELVYFFASGPAATGSGFGSPGGFGAGGFGTGVVPSSQTGSPIAATDWTSDNWGEILLACPTGNGIFYWDPTGGFQNAQIIAQGPPFATGIFVSMTQQILVAFGAAIHEGVGYIQDPLLVKWCDVGNFFNWTVSAATQAGSYRLSSGSRIVGGMAFVNQNLLWTDIDLWAMNYVGPPDVFGFVTVGAGADLASMHAAQKLRGAVYWMGRTNFYIYNGIVNVLPCPVWDAVFQNLNTSFLRNVRAMPNTNFNEVGWLYPSIASVSGECDSYVKANITEPGMPWDYGTLSRSAWIDESVLGPPIAAMSNGVIYQHETTPDSDGSPLAASFTTGEFYLAEGEDFVVVDKIMPDFKWALFPGGASAQIQLQFNVVNFPGDVPNVFGPYTVTSSTQYLDVRFRGRMMSITCSSTDLGSFWRLGGCKYRYSVAGRR